MSHSLLNTMHSTMQFVKLPLIHKHFIPNSEPYILADHSYIRMLKYLT
jgi:hypothetical protein